jgi:hypothetical protein
LWKARVRGLSTGARGKLMKPITTTASVHKADASLDVTLNPVALPSGEVVAWGVAFPRPDVTARPKATTSPS